MKAVLGLLVGMFYTYLLATLGRAWAAQDAWCSALVKGVVYGSYSLAAMFPGNLTNCTWTLENPDPTKYSVHLRLHPRRLSCGHASLLLYQFDHFSHEKIGQLLRANDSVVYLCEAHRPHMLLRYDKNFVQLRRLLPDSAYDEDPPPDAGSALEFVILNRAGPSQFGCQVLCAWLESCLKGERATPESCGSAHSRCTCPQHLGDGGDSENVLLLSDVVLPLNPRTQGCLTPQPRPPPACNLSAEVRRPSKEGKCLLCDPSSPPPSVRSQPAVEQKERAYGWHGGVRSNLNG